MSLIVGLAGMDRGQGPEIPSQCPVCDLVLTQRVIKSKKPPDLEYLGGGGILTLLALLDANEIPAVGRSVSP
jgi:hypothetical protein